jgi:hypothetical protein
MLFAEPLHSSYVPDPVRDPERTGGRSRLGGSVELLDETLREEKNSERYKITQSSSLWAGIERTRNALWLNANRIQPTSPPAGGRLGGRLIQELARLNTDDYRPSAPYTL